jgi:golgi phosphoprotein 3
MDLNLIEKFILLSLDSKKGKFLIDAMSLNYGIAGAILLELSEEKKISIINKRLTISDFKLTGDKVIDASVKLISNSKKKRKTKYWVYKIGNKASGLKKIILDNLKNKKIVKITSKQYFFRLITIYRYPVINNAYFEELKKEIKDIVLANKKPNLKGLLLLSLMNSCKLTRVLFMNKKEHSAARKRIKELTKDIEISNEVSQTLKEIQAAVIIATS